MNFAALPGYIRWANTRTLGMLRRTASEQGVAIFAHLLATETVWAARITGDAPPFPAWPAWTLEGCAEAIPIGVERWQGIVSRFDPARPIAYRNSQGEAFTSAEGDILLHVLAHGAYHRGQIAQNVQAAGGEIVDTDYIYYRRQ